MSKEKIISFVGKSYAKKGFTFYFQTVKPICPPKCKYYQTCMQNLENETIYRVKRVLKKNMDCPYDLHEEPMKLVEIIKPSVEVSMENKDIFLGSIIKHNSIDCNKEDCKYYKYCVPSKLVVKNKERVKVLKKVKRIKKCPIGKHLTIVKLEKKDN